MAKYKIGIWGQYGDPGVRIADGQAVRTTIITQELEKRYGQEQICIANSNRWKKHPFRFILRCVYMVAHSDKILILPADNGFKVFVPILMLLNRIYHHELYYIVIGGFLPDLLRRKPNYLKYVKKFKAIFVQTNNLKRNLQVLGIDNIYILSNLKRLNTRKREDIIENCNQKIKLCTFSRVNKEKGIEDAICAVKLANEKLGKEYIKLDIYGLLPNSYRNQLEELLKENGEFVSYCGIVEYNKTVEILKNYFALLFPTFYYGEGFPGNLVDAFNAALPVIATDWMYNSEIVKNDVHGILVPPHNPDAICDAILKLYSDRKLVLNYAYNCLEEAKKYQPDNVMKDLYGFLD